MNISEHYRDLFKKYGDRPEAVQWSNVETQEKRFAILMQIGDLNGANILDFGCGTGHLATFLERNNIKVSYTGVDIVPEMLECGKAKNPKAKFYVLDQFNTKEKYDYTFISGVFNNKIADNRKFYRDIIKKCFEKTLNGLAFNMMSYYVDYYDEFLFYEKPETVFSFIKNEISPYVTIRNDYQLKDGIIPFEFTTYVYKK